MARSGGKSHNAIDAETCRKVREMRRRGWWYAYIADQFGISLEVVGYHVRAECRHVNESLGFGWREKP